MYSLLNFLLSVSLIENPPPFESVYIAIKVFGCFAFAAKCTTSCWEATGHTLSRRRYGNGKRDLAVLSSP